MPELTFSCWCGASIVTRLDRDPDALRFDCYTDSFYRKHIHREVSDGPLPDRGRFAQPAADQDDDEGHSPTPRAADRPPAHAKHHREDGSR